MTTSPVLRMLMVVYLAIWSPALCCCAIKGAIGSVTGIDAAWCGARRCCAAPDQPTRIAESNCCAQNELPECEKEAPSKDDACQCHEKTIDLVQLDTGAKLTQPVLTVVLWQAMVPNPVDSGLHGTRMAATPARESERAHPPPGSLLALRCLLII